MNGSQYGTNEVEIFSVGQRLRNHKKKKERKKNPRNQNEGVVIYKKEIKSVKWQINMGNKYSGILIILFIQIDIMRIQRWRPSLGSHILVGIQKIGVVVSKEPAWISLFVGKQKQCI